MHEPLAVEAVTQTCAINANIYQKKVIGQSHDVIKHVINLHCHT